MASSRPVKLNARTSMLGGVGAKLEIKLQRLGINTLQDLLFHLPYRYIDRTQLHPIGSLQPGQQVLIEGIVELTQVRYGKRRSLLCRISDGTGALTLRFFHFTKSQQLNLAKNTRIRCWGTLRSGITTLEMIHPEYQSIKTDNYPPLEQTLTPVYPATEGLTQGRMRRLTEQALHSLQQYPNELSELLPQVILDKYDLPDLVQALNYVHRPPVDTDIDTLKKMMHPAQRRLVLEELLAHHLSLRSLRKQIHSLQAPVLPLNNQYYDPFINQLPFRLTEAQKTVINQIQQDLERDVPMLRLVQGDVGSGKTVVAIIAALQAIDAGFQVAMMAPTELLAEQHYSTIKAWLSSSDITVHLLSGKLTQADRKQVLTSITSTEPLIVIGTHALFQENVKFTRLGLVIIDEQHRFGVHQRFALLEKGISRTTFPHQLIMTATPIPRTLAMTVFADLDLSVIDELPPGRQAINTLVMANERRPEIINKISEICDQGRQVYWVCTLIEESDAVENQAAIDTHQYLAEMLPDLSIGLVHGRLKSTDKERIMSEYRSGNINILVATTVIEVGVDVPAASLMVIENAERLGLSQLHQLRGRIGRGNRKSDCILMYQPPLSEIAQTRLEIIRNTNDGFEIAKKDLELRGPGEILGFRQTGIPEMRIADLARDAALIPQVQNIANTLLQEFPDKVDALVKRWLTDQYEFGNV